MRPADRRRFAELMRHWWMLAEPPKAASEAGRDDVWERAADVIYAVRALRSPLEIALMRGGRL
jgi:hypothetical protein